MIRAIVVACSFSVTLYKLFLLGGCFLLSYALYRTLLNFFVTINFPKYTQK